MAHITVQVEFASNKIRAVDALKDLQNAAESACLNLLSKYDVRLQWPRRVNDNQVIMDMTMPDDIVDDFKVGPHLKGIATYLLKNCEGYDKYLVGKRLLEYTVIPAPDETNNGIPMANRLRAMSDFAKLLENNDEVSLNKICRIIAILKEA